MPPKHALLTDTVFKFVVGFGLAGGAVWKGWSMIGGNHHDHEALESTADAKQLERLVRRSSSSVNAKTGELHPQALANKQAA